MKISTSSVTAALRDRAATADPGREVAAAIPWHEWMARSLSDDEAGYVSLLNPDTFGPALADLLDALADENTTSAKEIAASIVRDIAVIVDTQAADEETSSR